ncbi:hypothetical protein PR202_ga15726 [Eleusine coracana subsp. coracana]|uniref:Uncharacterized protein n=1 Tax=Eleusine coracana subsp. coracana TaxID=191504 RepID=A0AAV5CJU5_ELECO|nr:hypothetical protein PR202_ga15726 [Eleusine coracana subsp. coracana]
MTRPEKGPSLSERALESAPAPALVPREAEEEAADDGWCIPGSTSLAHPLLATTSTPLLLRDIAGAAAEAGGGGTRAAHVGETLKGGRGSVRRGESKAREGFRGGGWIRWRFREDGQGRETGEGAAVSFPFSGACSAGAGTEREGGG